MRKPSGEEFDGRVLNPFGVEIDLPSGPSGGLRNCICSNGIGELEGGESARTCLS